MIGRGSPSRCQVLGMAAAIMAVLAVPVVGNTTAKSASTPPPPGAHIPAFASEMPAGVPANYPADMDQAQSDYVEHCGGCHGIHGVASPAELPTIGGRVGWFMCTPEGRSYLVRLPNVARSRITDNAQLADLMNFMVFGLGGRSTPAGSKPFTADEVARGRTTAFTSVSLVKTRAQLVDRLIRTCGAPASLRLMYPPEAGRMAHPAAGKGKKAG